MILPSTAKFDYGRPDSEVGVALYTSYMKTKVSHNFRVVLWNRLLHEVHTVHVFTHMFLPMTERNKRNRPKYQKHSGIITIDCTMYHFCIYFFLSLSLLLFISDKTLSSLVSQLLRLVVQSPLPWLDIVFTLSSGNSLLIKIWKTDTKTKTEKEPSSATA